MNRIRVVVIGTGFIGPVHVEALKRAGIEVAGIVGSTPQKSLSTSAMLGLPGRFESFQEVLDDSEVHSIHLATPNVLHFEQARKVLMAGKHCLCEKPLAMNSRESQTLVDLAAASGLAAGVAYNIRFYPLCHEVADRVHKGGLGRMLHITGSYVQDWLLNERDFNWRVLPETGGELRAIADIGTHWLDLVQFISGSRVISVCADLQTVHTTRQQPTSSVETFSGKPVLNATAVPQSQSESVSISTDDAGCVMLRFDNGAHGCLWVSQTTAGRKNRLCFEIAGSHQSFAWNSEVPNELWIGHRDRSNEMFIRDPALMGESAAKISNYPGGHNEGFPDTFKQLFRSFYGYIDRGDFSAPPPFPTFTDGHREILLCEAILKSHKTRCWMNLP
jgi:predicted dehydrogenase